MLLNSRFHLCFILNGQNSKSLLRKWWRQYLKTLQDFRWKLWVPWRPYKMFVNRQILKWNQVYLWKSRYVLSDQKYFWIHPAYRSLLRSIRNQALIRRVLIFLPIWPQVIFDLAAPLFETTFHLILAADNPRDLPESKWRCFALKLPCATSWQNQCYFLRIKFSVIDSKRSKYVSPRKLDCSKVTQCFVEELSDWSHLSSNQPVWCRRDK